MNNIEECVTKKYNIIGFAGQGAVASVYKVQKKGESVLYALKVSADKAVLKREAEFLQGLSCKYFPRFYEWMEGELAYLVMEYIEGFDLQEIMDGGMVFSVDEAIWIMEQVLLGLKYLHEQKPGIVYRDLKPGNIMIETSGGVRVTDLGSVSGMMEAGVEKRTGTYGYAAPEQFWEGMKPTPDWDVYAAGKLLGYMLTGKNPAIPPYHVEEIYFKDRRIPQAFREVIQRCLSDSSEGRYENAGELLKAMKLAKDAGGRKRILGRRPEIKYKKCIWLSEYRRIF